MGGLIDVLSNQMSSFAREKFSQAKLLKWSLKIAPGDLVDMRYLESMVFWTVFFYFFVKYPRVNDMVYCKLLMLSFEICKLKF